MKYFSNPGMTELLIPETISGEPGGLCKSLLSDLPLISQTATKKDPSGTIYSIIMLELTVSSNIIVFWISFFKLIGDFPYPDATEYDCGTGRNGGFVWSNHGSTHGGANVWKPAAIFRT
jgi:hypothetical protein